MGFPEPEFSAFFDSGIQRIFQFLCAVADQDMADAGKQHSTGFSVEPSAFETLAYGSLGLGT